TRQVSSASSSRVIRRSSRRGRPASVSLRVAMVFTSVSAPCPGNGYRAQKPNGWRQNGGCVRSLPWGAHRGQPRSPWQRRGHPMTSLVKQIGWIALAVIGAFALGTVALARGETINALWIVVAAVAVYLVAYRYYALYLANTVVGVNLLRVTPALRHNDGLDYVPTNKYVLFGHHFAAIAGAGPLVGPVLAAQMGYLP